MLPEPQAIDAARASADPHWLTVGEQNAWRAYIRFAKMLMRQLDRDLHPFGLTTNDYEILVELSEAPGRRLRMTELADLTAQSRSRLSHQVTRMEARGLVKRDACDGDKRGTFAVITARGLATIERVAPSHVESVRRYFIDQVSEQDLAQLTQAFGPALAALLKTRDRD
ncbi:MAG TPA: MarR family transcriptional regulator [Trebonia sp.]|jgi:DNA-binding MarR family transcriptional regulator|nr:MarR family transcriptional regulator [Trebonia sp.]